MCVLMCVVYMCVLCVHISNANHHTSMHMTQVYQAPQQPPLHPCFLWTPLHTCIHHQHHQHHHQQQQQQAHPGARGEMVQLYNTPPQLCNTQHLLLMMMAVVQQLQSNHVCSLCCCHRVCWGCLGGGGGKVLLYRCVCVTVVGFV